MSHQECGYCEKLLEVGVDPSYTVEHDITKTIDAFVCSWICLAKLALLNAKDYVFPTA